MNLSVFSALSHAECRDLLNAAPVMLRRLNSRQQCSWTNPAWLTFCGRTAREERGLGWAANVHPEDLPGVIAMLISATGNKRPVQLQYRLRRADGEYCWVEERGGTLWKQRTFAGHVLACSVIPKPTQETFTRLLMHEFLRHAEFAHRVKNTLQLIVSTIQLEARQAPDQSNRLQQAASRIHAIVTVQDRIDALENGGRVDINRLLADIAVSVLGIQARLALDFDLPDQPVLLPTARASTLGLILSEAIMNSIKHASGRGATVIRLVIKHRDPDLYIEVSDDGPGFPAKVLRKNDVPRSLGLSLFKSMAAQANAQLRLLNREGAVVRLTLSLRQASQ